MKQFYDVLRDFHLPLTLPQRVTTKQLYDVLKRFSLAT